MNCLLGLGRVRIGAVENTSLGQEKARPASGGQEKLLRGPAMVLIANKMAVETGKPQEMVRLLL
ncbi:hypothetical protein EXN66_Car010017 [Channa argus]|uniref:Uncharacterized protein n=1 Tax=Channa argus TaxID=215402 RepID=A0A6G1PVH5_CHAAH|nr:hypothetical protein EXN66_Car010017 [Channa argus]